jgi:uncharacterized protein
VKRGAAFKGYLITNGFLLDEPTAKRLSRAGIAKAQVTIDGPRSVHNRRRRLRSSPDFDTYSRIVDNVNSAREHIEIIIRVNVENEEIDLDAMKADLHPDDSVRIHLAPTDYSYCGDLARTQENLEFTHSICPDECLVGDVLHASVAGCGAAAMAGMMIMPDGSILRCWEEVEAPGTPDYGNILKQDRPRPESILHWMTWDPYAASSRCSSCRILPQCGGGCPLHWIRTGNTRCRTTPKDFHKVIRANHSARTSKIVPGLAGDAGR